MAYVFLWELVHDKNMLSSISFMIKYVILIQNYNQSSFEMVFYAILYRYFISWSNTLIYLIIVDSPSSILICL